MTSYVTCSFHEMSEGQNEHCICIKTIVNEIENRCFFHKCWNFKRANILNSRIVGNL